MDFEPDLFRLYPLCSTDDCAEFYECYTNDDGDEDEQYVEYDCVSFYRDMEDYYAEDETQYVKSRRLRYNIIEMEVECDENEKIIWNVA
jgi:hypothetical protein